MAIITYIDPDDVEHKVSVNPGFTVMEGAIWSNVPGIEAQCGGSCACATCHVYVDEQWKDIVGPQNDMEQALLECTESVRENSRLSCQIKVSKALDGLILRIPSRP